jgi:CubicO group peptidase (beta-lactamase class C family)
MSRRVLLALLVAVVAFVLPLHSRAQAQAAGVTDADIASGAGAYMQALADARHFNGTVLFARNGHVVFEHGYGMANFEWDIPNTPATKFRLGSVTKQFTSMAIMQLEARGLLHRGRSDGEVPHGLSKAGRRPGHDPPSAHAHLGDPTYTGLPGFSQLMTLPLTPTALIDKFKDLPLDFAPGSQFKYDNSGYFLLGQIIEKVSGETYEAYVKKHIFEPLGMADSGYDWPKPLIKNRASGYAMTSAGVQNAPYLDMGLPYAAGSLYSTVDDLFKWDQALYTEKLLPKASLDRIFKGWVSAGSIGSYGYGWGVSEIKGHHNLAHSGGINGFSTYISRFPDDRAVFIWLVNVTGAGAPNTLNQDLAGILLGVK